jgi:protease-4
MAKPKRTARPKSRGSRLITSVLVGLTVVGVLAFVVSIGFVVWVVSKADTTPTVNDGTWMYARLDGQITDAPASGGLLLDPDDVPLIVVDYSAAIRAAGTDDRISGLYLRLDSPAIGMAGMTEIRDALVDYSTSDKPCVAYSEAYDTRSYYLASACDTVLAAPSGVMFVNGMALTVSYYAGMFEKLNIVPEFQHVGDFKTAVEPYERSGPSESAMESYEYLLDGIWPHIVGSMAEGRGISVDVMQSYIDDMQLTPSAAVERDMLDGLAFPAAVVYNVTDFGSEGWMASMDTPAPDLTDTQIEEKFTFINDYVKSMRQADTAEKRIAVVFAEGPIISGDGNQGLFSGPALADGPFREWMQAVRESEDVVAVVVRVNSPGGSALASDMMWREIERTKAMGLPVVISQADYAASGGYFITAPGDYVFSHPTTIIGVLGGKMNLGGTYEMAGITSHTYLRGERADFFSTVSSFDEGEQQAFQTYLDDFYETFLARVTAGRPLTRDEAHAVAQGRVWTGEQALERNLVDEIGGLDDALAKAAELASVTEYGVDRYPKSRTFFEILLEDLSSAEATIPVDIRVDGLLPHLEEAVSEVMLLDAIFSDGAVMYLPGSPTFE